MKILVTGSTGLLGTDISYTLEESGYDLLKACHSERGGKFIAADITSEEGMETLTNQDWDCIVHTSAWKNPDECENKESDTYRINVWATEQLAKAAAEKNAKMIFISTDYVFSGNNPPYSEDSAKNPINYYGKTKSMAEDKIAAIASDYCILRVPILYGIRAGLKASDVLNSSLKAIQSKNNCIVDNFITRYPTYTGDVADAVKCLIEKDAQGIFHCSGTDKTTKYGIIKLLGKLLDLNTAHIKPLNSKPASNAARPLDCHLSTKKYSELNNIVPLSFEDRLKSIIEDGKI